MFSIVNLMKGDTLQKPQTPSIPLHTPPPRFSIVNLMKGDSLYNHGLRPLLYSSKEAALHGVGWRRCATNIVYFRNQDR